MNLFINCKNKFLIGRKTFQDLQTTSLKPISRWNYSVCTRRITEVIKNLKRNPRCSMSMELDTWNAFQIVRFIGKKTNKILRRQQFLNSYKQTRFVGRNAVFGFFRGDVFSNVRNYRVGTTSSRNIPECSRPHFQWEKPISSMTSVAAASNDLK